MSDGYRRFSVTKHQAETIGLALTCLIDELEKITAKDGDLFWKLHLMRAETLRNEITTYDFTKGR